MYLDDPKDMTGRLLSMIGEPYEKPDGCIKFVRRCLWEFGVYIEGTKAAALRDGRLFVPAQVGSLGTVIVWRMLPGQFVDQDFHVGLMLDSRYALQSSIATNGAARVEISRWPWADAFKGFYRPKLLCT